MDESDGIGGLELDGWRGLLVLDVEVETLMVM